MFNFPQGVIYISKTLKENGYSAYVVGGSIRDILIGKNVYDWDITTDASCEQIEKLFKKTLPTGIKYGTITVLLDDGNYEITTFRCDEKYSDGRRPDKVTFTKNINEDLSRRDFTVNAIAYDPVNNLLVDPFDGQKDIKNRVLRAVGDPLMRLSEDGLRAMRACRFAAKLGFDIEEKTLDAISKTLNIFIETLPVSLVLNLILVEGLNGLG